MLKFDDDFRHIQALYNYWLSESHHLHLTRLQPKQTAMAASANDQKPESQAPVGTTRGVGNNNNASFTTDGRIICRNFNRQRGCPVSFLQVCACLQSQGVWQGLWSNSYKFPA